MHSKDKAKAIVLSLVECCLGTLPSVRCESKSDKFLDSATIAIQNHRYQDALAFCNQAIELTPQKASAYLGRARIYTGLRQFPEALLDTTKAISINPRLPQPYLLRARIYRKLGDPNSALENVCKYISLVPSDPAGHFIQGLIYVEESKLEEARRCFTQVITLKPNAQEGYSWRAHCSLKLSDCDQALVDLERSLSIRRCQGDLNNHGAALIDMNDVQGAVRDYTAAIAMEPPKNPLSYFMRARCHHILKNYHLAVKDYSSAIRCLPTQWQYFLYRGKAYEALGDVERARKDFHQASLLEPSFSDTYYLHDCAQSPVTGRNRQHEPNPSVDSLIEAALKYQSKKEFPKAIDCFTQALKLDSNNNTVLNLRAKTYLQMKKFELALSDLHRIPPFEDIGAAGCAHESSMAYSSMGAFKRALCTLNVALFWNENDIDLYFDRALVLEKLKRNQDALQDYTTYVTLATGTKPHDNEKLHTAIERIKSLDARKEKH